jgi:hypothetical protein
MWSLTHSSDRRTHGPGNFCPMIEKEFCNSIPPITDVDTGGSGRSVAKTSSSRRARVTATLRRRWPPSLLGEDIWAVMRPVLSGTDGHREDDDVRLVALHIVDVLDQDGFVRLVAIEMGLQ